ncbi:type II toxin-antitoxin system RelE/ParE family toxin [Pantanalinema sp. GBBB05]|uniref:type II toxin-antitoxin system RelE/ParE family toxin n=1 Tax=Pantanalinema sp. GBBB05 TaxID=2604139 RepID=UPI001D1EF866|nr:type II toxin-antitoxin system RelE/ParE family toxin [Pantanalinema sp. GBBB05]
MTESPSIQVFIADAFKREARTLKKRYRNIESDLQALIEQLQNGDLPGDRVPGFADYVVYKVRVKNSDIQKGKSGSYRVIYQSIVPTTIVLLYLYAKSDQDDVTLDEICTIIEKFQADSEVTDSK